MIGVGFSTGRARKRRNPGAATGFSIVTTIDGPPPWTFTAPSGWSFVASAVAINIPAKPLSSGSAQTVNATITAGGEVGEDSPGDYATDLIAAGCEEGDPVTITITGATIEAA